jgi:methionyl-tRNA synthetase
LAGATSLMGVSPASLVDLYGVDGVRYHLLRDTPLGTDGEFSLESMTARYNSDLANNLGNLVARVTTVVASKCGGVGPAASITSPLREIAAGVLNDAASAWARFAPHAALEASWRLIGAANAHLESHEPWKMEPGPAVDAVMGDSLEAIRIISVLVAPAVPATAAEIRRRIGVDVELPPGSWQRALDDPYPGGLAVTKGTPLFPRITAEP